jgi:hypothetical protein
MAEHEYTPGPWHTGSDEDGDIVYGPDCELVASAAGDGDAEAEVANARLIAAAPELLWACETALRALEFQGNGPRPHVSEAEWDEIAAAIAKARGKELPS